MANDYFIRQGIYRLYAYILGLTKYRGVLFYDDYFELIGPKIHLKLKYSDVQKIQKGGLVLNSLKFFCEKKYVFRGLSKNDIHVLENKFLKAEKMHGSSNFN